MNNRHKRTLVFIPLDAYTAEYYKAIKVRATSAYCISSAVVALFWVGGFLHWGFAPIVGGIWAGFILWDGQRDIHEAIGVWSKTMRETSSFEECQTAPAEVTAADRPIGAVEIVDKSGRPVWTVRLTTGQLTDLIGSGEVGTKMLRRQLDPAKWDNLSRKWNSGKIINDARKLGIVSPEGLRLVGGGNPERGLPEGNTNSGTGAPAGGSL
jgi:hypothetical protein